MGNRASGQAQYLTGINQLTGLWVSSKQRFFIDNTKWIAEWISPVKTPFAPRLGHHLITKLLATGLLYPFEECLGVFYRKLHMLLIGTGVKSIPIRLRIETGKDGSAAIEIMPTWRNPFSFHIQQQTIEVCCLINIRYR